MKIQYSNVMIRELNEYNLCSFYLLPLCGVGFYTFGGQANFINSWVHPDGLYIYVQVIDKVFINPAAFNANYIGRWIQDDQLLGYSIPKQWKPEFNKFKEGKYSEFREEAKKIIRETSGLVYRLPGYTGNMDGSGLITDMRLAALYKDEGVRIRLQLELGAIIVQGQELMEMPKEQDFRSID